MKVTDPILQIFRNCLYALWKKYNDKCFFFFDTLQYNKGSNGNMVLKAYRNLIFVILILILKYYCKYFKPFMNWASLLLDAWDKVIPLNSSFIRGQQKSCGDRLLFIMNKIHECEYHISK
jgi:hypothetical protein